MNAMTGVMMINEGLPVSRDRLGAYLTGKTAPGDAPRTLPRLSDFWFRKNAGSRGPQRADFQPEELVSVLPDVFILDCLPDGTFRYRLAGTRLAGSFPKDPTTRLTGSFAGHWADRTIGDFAVRVAESASPHLMLTNGPEQLSAGPVGAAVAAPLFDDDGNVNMVLGAVIFGSATMMAQYPPIRMAIYPILP